MKTKSQKRDDIIFDVTEWKTEFENTENQIAPGDFGKNRFVGHYV